MDMKEIATVLAGVGALNWGLAAVNAGWNILALSAVAPYAVYVQYAIGIAGAAVLADHFGVYKLK